jgi:hypothetical protein
MERREETHIPLAMALWANPITNISMSQMRMFECTNHDRSMTVLISVLIRVC